MSPESSGNKFEAVDKYYYQGNQGGIAMSYGGNRGTFGRNAK